MDNEDRAANLAVLLSSFLALTQEKKQKKVKASGTPANFPSLGRDYQRRRPNFPAPGRGPSGKKANFPSLGEDYQGRRPIIEQINTSTGL